MAMQFKKITSSKNLAILLSLCIILSLIFTYTTITSIDGYFSSNPNTVLVLASINLFLLLALAGIISKKIIKLIIDKRRNKVGSKLQTKIVIIFSFVTIIPTIIMALFALIFFNLGIQSWFDSKVSIAIGNSVAVAKLYLEEHKKIIAADILGMANDLDRDAYNIRLNPKPFNQKVSILAGIRKLPEAIVFQYNENNQKNTLARTSLSSALQFVLDDLDTKFIKKAKDGELVVITKTTDDRVIALIRLENYFDTYLIVGRFVDNNIIKHTETTTGAANQYKNLKENISVFQFKFFAIFIIVALMLLFFAIWVGISFALNLIEPLSSLVNATNKVKDGDLSARVKESKNNDEIGVLTKAFNLMIQKLDEQQHELISAQRRLVWSDVARRIAHEIKNPLTPISLSSQRLKKKYSGNVEDKEQFNNYINTIIRNVDNIGKMVDEFASFARIPAPKFSDSNICEIANDVIFLREVAQPKIRIIKDYQSKLVVSCDSGQISQLLTNLIKNSQESILETKNIDSGLIHISIKNNENKCQIVISDNGKGFDSNAIDSLTEPYVTTKTTGTGLGLAIVKKIIEDHNGAIDFTNNQDGACINVTIGLNPVDNNEY